MEAWEPIRARVIERFQFRRLIIKGTDAIFDNAILQPTKMKIASVPMWKPAYVSNLSFDKSGIVQMILIYFFCFKFMFFNNFMEKVRDWKIKFNARKPLVFIRSAWCVGWYPISTKKNFFLLKRYSDRVLSPDSEYRSQNGRFGR